MGIFDKFLDIMKLNDDDDYDDDYYDEDDDSYEEEYEERPRHSIFNNTKKSGRDDYNDFDMQEERSRSNTAVSNKVTPMRQPVSRRGGNVNMEVCVVKPISVDDSREITETLLAGRTVILNLEGMDLEIAQRIIDFISGATFAISGNLQKISNYIFLVTPTNVDISGDLQDLLSSSMEQPTVRGRF
ncbi:MAG: cell division protein SepF [Ruminococcus sp.]|nr:cell division protein SepF [Ruminococcus sp.]